MKKLIIFVFVSLFCSFCYADRICVDKSTGKLIEYQSGNAPLGTLTQNAINAGYSASDIEEKYVTKSEWEIIKFNQITKPAKDKNEVDKANKKVKIDSVSQKLKGLGFTDSEIEVIVNW